MKTFTLLLILVFTGCATISVETPEGLKAKYKRWGDQEIQGLAITLPDGAVITLEGQKSEGAALAEAIRIIGQLAVPVVP